MGICIQDFQFLLADDLEIFSKDCHYKIIFRKLYRG